MKNVSRSKLKKSFSFGNTCFELFKSLLEHSSSVFDNRLLRTSNAFYITFAYIPLAFLTLGNEYKGDNITRLTLPTLLVSFDTYDTSVENNFQIFVRWQRITASFYGRLKKRLV